MDSCRNKKTSGYSAMKKKEERFVTNWDNSPKPIEYNAFEDKHNGYFFRLPNIQAHLKKLKNKLKKEPASNQTALMQSINKQTIASKQQTVPESLKVYMEDYVKHFHLGYKGIGSARENLLGAGPTRYQSSQRSHIRRSYKTKKQQLQGQKAQTQQSLDHQTFSDYLKCKKQQVFKDDGVQEQIQQF